MAIGQIMQFSGAGLDKYDAVRRELGWEGDKGKPEGIVAHAAGSTTDGFCVTEWWSSEGAWDKFKNLKRLIDEINARPAAAKAVALKDKHKFKTEMDDEAKNAMFRHLTEKVA